MPKTIEQIDQLGEAITDANVAMQRFQIARNELNDAIQRLDERLAAFKQPEPADPAPAG